MLERYVEHYTQLGRDQTANAMWRAESTREMKVKHTANPVGWPAWVRTMLAPDRQWPSPIVITSANSLLLAVVAELP